MSAEIRSVIDIHTGKPDRGLQADVALEAEIDAACKSVTRKGANDRESQDALTELVVLMRRRSFTQLVKLEFELRALRVIV
jgi:hypothetical protein